MKILTKPHSRSTTCVSAILLAAGSGQRLGRATAKAFVELDGLPLWQHALATLDLAREIGEIVLVVPRAFVTQVKRVVLGKQKVRAVLAGGDSRAESLSLGLRRATADWILVHNAANPLLTREEITATIRAAKKCGAAATAHLATATVKHARAGRVLATLDRSEIYLTETPQVVRRDLLLTGLQIAKKKKMEATDDLQLAELAGATPVLVQASSKNHKITTQADLARAESAMVKPVEWRIGLGQDSHRFAIEPRPLVLAGVQLSSSGGLMGESDADVILHAACNALSSALGGGSLSTWADRLCQSGVTDSQIYLEQALAKVKKAGWTIGNLVVALEAARPRLEAKLPRLKNNLARLLEIEPERVGITVTSGEGLTACGRGEGIAALAQVLISKRLGKEK